MAAMTGYKAAMTAYMVAVTACMSAMTACMTTPTAYRPRSAPSRWTPARVSPRPLLEGA
jgi:hypothetical protein